MASLVLQLLLRAGEHRIGQHLQIQQQQEIAALQEIPNLLQTVIQADR